MSDVRVQHYVDLIERHGVRAVIEFLVGVIDEERRGMAQGDRDGVDRLRALAVRQAAGRQACK